MRRCQRGTTSRRPRTAAPHRLMVSEVSGSSGCDEPELTLLAELCESSRKMPTPRAYDCRQSELAMGRRSEQ